jgi:hypothetical protein
MNREQQVHQSAGDTGYETDFHNWTATQAARLRRLKPASIDWLNIAEELSDMGRSEQCALESHLAVLLVHLLKWKYQPDNRTNSWETSIENARDEIDELLRRSPSLGARLKESLRIAYRRARRTAGTEMGLSRQEREARLPTACEWTLAELCNNDFWP